MLNPINLSTGHFRVEALAQWLGDSARVALQRNGIYTDDAYRPSPRERYDVGLPSPAPAHVHTIAAILWQSHELPVCYNLPDIITKDLLR